MESIHQLYAILGITGGLFSYMGFSKYLEHKKLEIETKSKETADKLSGEEQKRYLDTINKAVEAIKEISKDVVIQKAINKPKKDIAKILEDDVGHFKKKCNHSIPFCEIPTPQPKKRPKKKPHTQ